MWLYYVRRYKYIIWGSIIFLIILLLVGIGIRSSKQNKGVIEEETYAGKVMGTAIKKTIFSEKKSVRNQVNQDIDSILGDLEKQISVRISDSEVSKCNRNYVRGGVYRLSPFLLEYLQQEFEISKETDNAFSPCVRPLSVLWGIEDGKTEIPDEKDIEKRMKLVKNSSISLKKDGIVFQNDNMAIDFGASGKGIACDQVMEYLEKSKVEGAVVSIGGSVVVYGSKGDQKPWYIGIRDPRGNEDEILGVMDCKDHTFISTSGDYEKFFEKNFKRYHHILDPRTGYPADNELMAVTIVGDNGFLSDVLSTTCFVLGLEKGMKYAQEKGFEGVFVTKDKEVFVTDGIKKDFRIKNKDYSLMK